MLSVYAMLSLRRAQSIVTNLSTAACIILASHYYYVKRMRTALLLSVGDILLVHVVHSPSLDPCSGSAELVSHTIGRTLPDCDMQVEVPQASRGSVSLRTTPTTLVESHYSRMALL